MTDQINTSASQQIDHIFWRMFQLLAVFGGIALALILVHHRLRKRSG
jgi:heme/copper-type cytochrome/quinol oxidase subunit 2